MTDNRQDIPLLKALVLCSILASLTALLQLSSVFVPAAGHFLSPFSTLPVAIATMVRPSGGITASLVAAALVFVVQPLEVPVLLLTSAPLGWVLAMGIHSYRSRWLTTAAGSIVFFTGTTVMSYIAGEMIFGGAVGTPAFYKILVSNAFIALFYAGAWEVLVRRVLKRLMLFFPYLRH